MICEHCHQHNPAGRERCWNCAQPLRSTPEAERKIAGEADAGQEKTTDGDSDDIAQLGVLGPLRPGQGPERAHYPVMNRVPQQSMRAARHSRRLLVQGAVAGAVVGGAAMGIVFGLFAAAAADLLEASGISRGATLLVFIAQGFITGAVQGAIVGALSAYYGDCMWTGAKAGAGLAAGTWLAQMLATGWVVFATLSAVMVTVVVLALAGAAIGALVGAAVEALAPAD